MKTALRLTVVTLLLAVSNLSAITHYVSLGSTNPTPPYTNWATAATTIQQAVDAAAAGDVVVVTNGIYGGGLAVTNPLALLSVNGPQFTVINGGGTNQCVSLTNGASLSGFTLTKGSGHNGGGVWCASTNAFLTNCVLTSNRVAGNLGGGAFDGTLYNCTLTGNSAGGGGGGGGAVYCTLYNCTLTGNSAGSGGGALGCTLYNCTLTGNLASDGSGGGAYNSTFYNCVVYFNTAMSGANYDTSSTLNYCCTTPLPTSGVGNTALDPQLASASHLSADSPCRGAGSAAYATGTDIDGESWGNPPSIGCDEYHAGAVTGPLTVSLVASYTNVAVGFPVSLTALIEGRTSDSVWEFGDGDVAINQPYVNHIWAEPGDYLVVLWAFNESHEGGVSATVTIHVLAQPVCHVSAASTNPQSPYLSWATAATNIQDAVDATALPGALVLVSNGVYAGSVAVTNPLTLRSVNGAQLTLINGGFTNRCVSLIDGASLTGFTLTNGWTAGSGAGVWCPFPNAFLTNCIIRDNLAYQGAGGALGGTLYDCTLAGNWTEYGTPGGAAGSTLYNCTLTGNQWGGASSCALYNCTLTANSGGWGGGAFSSTLTNCTLSGNTALQEGGGAYDCTLYNCRLTGNSVGSAGGGACLSTLYNCTLTGNSANIAIPPFVGPPSGGGAYGCTLYNCILYDNTATNGANYDSSSTLNYCCTADPGATGNITGDPLFADYANGNLRLQSNSPCINAGNNAYVTTTTDLDGRPRIVGGIVDMGAYEFQPGVSGMFIGWLQQYGLPTDGSADFVDTDGDGMNNWQEWVCGTGPTNRLSVLRLLSAAPASSNVTVNWQSVAGVNYFLARSANLASPFMLLATNIGGQARTTAYTDTNAAGAGPFFYRVGVKSP